MKKSGGSQGQSASELISNRIAELGDWRGETLGRMRKLIKEADPDVVEEWKWMGTPVWSHDGIICTGESYKNVVKLTFSKGASLMDPARLFNSSLDGNVRRAIDIHEGDTVDASAFKALVRQAVALNSSGKSKASKRATTTMKKSKSGSKEGEEGDSPAQLIDARIKELSDWRGETLARVRALIREADPDVVEEVKWRKPSNMLGVPVWEHDGIICTGETYRDKVKLTFVRGASLDDPSGLFNSSLEGNVRRAIDIREGDKIDEKALKALIRAAAALNTSKRATARPARAQKKSKRA